jgi:MFS family permease
VIVAVGALMTCVGIGAMFQLVMDLQPMSAETHHGTVFGPVTMTSSLGMAIRPLAGGWIFDTFNGYAWLYWGSFAVGLGAVAIALMFPPLPRHRLQPA